MSGRSEATPDQTREEDSLQDGKFRTFFCFLDCRQILVPVRLLHRHRRTHQVHPQVQHQSEVTNPHQKTGAIHQQPKTKKKRNDSRDSGDRLRGLPKWLEEFTENLEDAEMPAPAHSFLMSQIRNVLLKWHSGSTVSILISQKTEIANYAMLPNHDDKGSLQKAHWRSSTSSRNVW